MTTSCEQKLLEVLDLYLYSFEQLPSVERQKLLYADFVKGMVGAFFFRSRVLADPLIPMTPQKTLRLWFKDVVQREDSKMIMNALESVLEEVWLTVHFVHIPSLTLR